MSCLAPKIYHSTRVKMEYCSIGFQSVCKLYHDDLDIYRAFDLCLFHINILILTQVIYFFTPAFIPSRIISRGSKIWSRLCASVGQFISALLAEPQDVWTQYVMSVRRSDKKGAIHEGRQRSGIFINISRFHYVTYYEYNAIPFLFDVYYTLEKKSYHTEESKAVLQDGLGIFIQVG